MVAVNDTDDSILRFHHVGGLLRITLTGVKPATKTVTVTFDKDVTTPPSRQGKRPRTTS